MINCERVSTLGTIKKYYPTLKTTYEIYVDYCKNLIAETEGTEHSSFVNTYLLGVMSNDWRQIILEASKSEYLSSLLEKYIRNLNKDFIDNNKKAILRSIVLFILQNGQNDVQNAANIINMLWNILPGKYEICPYIGYAKNLNEDGRRELLSIWTFDISDITIFRRIFGEYIISHNNSKKYAEWFFIFIQWGLDIFSGKPIYDYLQSIDTKTAINLSKAYESLYSYPGYFPSYGDKRMRVLASYERNNFCSFLSNNDDEYFDIKNMYTRYENKNPVLKAYNRPKAKTWAALTQINALSAVINYYFVLNSEVSKWSISPKTDKKNNKLDYNDFINTVVMAISTEENSKHLLSFVSKFGHLEFEATKVILHIENRQYKEAFIIISKLKNDGWKEFLLLKMVSDPSINKMDSTTLKKCKELVKQNESKNNKHFFWLTNTAHVDIAPLLILFNASKNANEKLSSVEPITKKGETPSKIEETKTIAIVQEKRIASLSYEGAYNLASSFISDNGSKKWARDLIKRLNKYVNKQDLDSSPEVDLKMDLLLQAAIKWIDNRNENDDDDANEFYFRALALVESNTICNHDVLIATYNVFRAYIISFNSIDVMWREYYENKEKLHHLVLEQPKADAEKEIHSIAFIIKSLDEIAEILISDIVEDETQKRLADIRKALTKQLNRVPKPKYHTIYQHLNELLKTKIGQLNFVPQLTVEFSNGTKNSNNEIIMNETWYRDTLIGHIKGTVKNDGGNAAHDIYLSISIGENKTVNYKLDSLQADESIPFDATYKRDDAFPKEIPWIIDLEYFDPKNDSGKKAEHIVGHTKIEYLDNDYKIQGAQRQLLRDDKTAEGEAFCGRTNELAKLEGAYGKDIDSEQYPSMLITGLRRSGKSTIMKEFRRILESDYDNIVPIFVDAEGSSPSKVFMEDGVRNIGKVKPQIKKTDSFKRFQEHWREISERPNWADYLSDFFQECYEIVDNKKIIFMLDEMECIFFNNAFPNKQDEIKFFGIIRSIIQNDSEYVSFIFCGSDRLLTSCLEKRQESQMFQVLDRLFVGRMSYYDVSSMFDRFNEGSSVKFEPDAVAAIYKYTAGQVWYTKGIASKVLKEIYDEEKIGKEKIDVADVEAVISMFLETHLGDPYFGLLDKNLSDMRRAVIHAIAYSTNEREQSVSINSIADMIKEKPYKNNETGTEISSFDDKDALERDLSVLNKMDFLSRDKANVDSYYFSSELYRLYFSKRSIGKFLRVKENTLYEV